jgi:hypothetical protein
MPARFVPVTRPRRAGIVLAASLLAGLSVAVGCAPAATFPKIEGSVAINSPRLAPIPELMADAIEAAREEVETLSADGELRLAFNLPEETPRSVWLEVARRVPGAVPATASDAAVAHVQQVRVRPNDAEVDVVVEPRADRPSATPYLLTVSLKQEFLRDWRTIRTRAWRLPVDVPALAWAEDQRSVPTGAGEDGDDRAPATRPAPAADSAPVVAAPEPVLPAGGDEDGDGDAGAPPSLGGVSG